jgi:hypothetical protein
MTQCLEEVSFRQIIERRRPIREILPAEIHDPTTRSASWLKAASWVMVATLLISVPIYMKYQTPHLTPAIIRLSLGAAPLYEWYGFHRVAVEGTSLD